MVILQKKVINKKKEIFEVDYVKGFAMLFDKDKIKKIGMFDDNIFLYLEEIDLCKRLRSKKKKYTYVKNLKLHTWVLNLQTLAFSTKNVETGIGCGHRYILIKNFIIIFMFIKNIVFN